MNDAMSFVPAPSWAKSEFPLNESLSTLGTTPNMVNTECTPLIILCIFKMVNAVLARRRPTCGARGRVANSLLHGRSGAAGAPVPEAARKLALELVRGSEVAYLSHAAGSSNGRQAALWSSGAARAHNSV